MTIERLIKPTTEDALAISNLLLQLSESSKGLTLNSINKIIESGCSIIFVARLEGKVVGTFTLIIYSIPTTKKAIIEDVVVDQSKRGLRIGEQLIRYGIEFAKQSDVKKIELTSNPTRVAANALYQKLGFKVRDTNYYRLEI